MVAFPPQIIREKVIYCGYVEMAYLSQACRETSLDVTLVTCDFLAH